MGLAGGIDLGSSSAGAARVGAGVSCAIGGRWLVGACLLAITVTGSGGCGSRGPTPIPVNVPPLVTQMRGLLESYARSGELDSGMVSLREHIDALRATDAAKADALAAEFAKLEAARGAAAVKKQAEAMLGKL